MSNTGKTHSEETRRKMRESHAKRMTPEYRKGLSERGKGRVWSEESRKKLSLALKGRVVSDETRKKISKGNKGRAMPDKVRLALSKANMGRVISADSNRKRIISKIISRGWIIEQVCKKSGQIIDTFIGGADAERKTGVSISSISLVLSGGRRMKSAGGYGWRKSYDLSKLDELVKTGIQ